MDIIHSTKLPPIVLKYIVLKLTELKLSLLIKVLSNELEY